MILFSETSTLKFQRGEAQSDTVHMVHGFAKRRAKVHERRPA